MPDQESFPSLATKKSRPWWMAKAKSGESPAAVFTPRGAAPTAAPVGTCASIIRSDQVTYAAASAPPTVTLEVPRSEPKPRPQRVTHAPAGAEARSA